jgi:catechol 2,3-dioxygenase
MDRQMSGLPFAATTPVSVSRVGLKVRDATKLAEFYCSVIGLEELERDGETTTLGAHGRPLLVIERDPAARADDSRSAGLFHTAFLLPSRADLGRWIKRAAADGTRLDGASDHLVSEALYLSDPEGNGIEIYADRPKEVWPMKGAEIALATQRLDLADVAAEVPSGDPGWNGAPQNTIVGHVHLRVGDSRTAQAWWNEELGFDTAASYGGSAVFLSTGGYHHHIGANSWHSAGAGRRDPARAGLSWLELRSTAAPKAPRLEDPWGTEVRVVQGLPG